MKDFTETYIPNRRELRLAIELVDQAYPLFKHTYCAEDKAQLIRDMFGWEVPTERIANIPPFKKILFKTVIISVTEHNGKRIIKHKKVRIK